MSFISSKLIHRAVLVVFMSVSGAACTKTVTNNVPGATISTPPAPASNNEGGKAPSESGGVINGGGGKGVRCTKDGKQTVEVLDLYEAKSIYNLTLKDFGTSDDLAKTQLAEVLARHFWNPNTISMDRYTKFMKELMVDEFFKNIRFVEDGKRLKLTNDSFEPMLESGCESVQIAVYYDESVLLVDRELWSQLNWTNKVALIAHEALYFLARQNGSKNSMGIRKLVGMMFSNKSLRPIADGVPKDRDRFVQCDLRSGGFDKGYFYLYSSQSPDGKKGLEAVFKDLGSDGSLFRTAAFLDDLSFGQLRAPTFKGARTATLVKDTYPNRDSIRLEFKGIIDGELTAELRFLRGGGGTTAEVFEVSCRMPSPNDDKLDDFSTEPGEFESQNNVSFVDKLIINGNGSMSLDVTRQVGGTGGISNYGVVPYPTVCRYTERGLIKKRDAEEITYVVFSAEFGNLDGLKDTAHCHAYIDAYNRKAADGSVQYTLRMNEYKRVK